MDISGAAAAIDRMIDTFHISVLTRRRIWLAFTVAILADAVQLLLGPFGLPFADGVIDVIALVFTSYLIGFHVLLLPTFVAELMPIVDLLPTWTACVAVVISLRRKQQPASPPPPRAPTPPGVIDI
jgi:hypothetical protein